MKKFLVAALCLLMTSTLTFSAAQADNQSKLKNLMQEIRAVKDRLSKDTRKRSSLQTKLNKTETLIGHVSKKLRGIQKQLDQQQEILRNLNKQLAQNEMKLAIQQKALQQQIRASYMLGQQQYFKMLLNQQNPNEFSRTLTYYDYLNHSRLTLITELKITSNVIKQNKQQAEKHRKKLQALVTQQQSERVVLRESNAKRKTVIGALGRKIKTKKQRLSKLEVNKQALKNVVSKLQRQRSTVTKVNFAALRGKLLWPTQGRIIQTFGKQIGNSQLRSRSVLIAAKLGQPVRAIAPGKVIFARWMSGYGLLMIIDHGKGYMTLYGRNNSLYRAVGDTVKTGDLIARVGKSGGYQNYGLYFSIRHNRSALNPQRWCAASPRTSYIAAR